MNKVLALCVLLSLSQLMHSQTGFAYVPGANPVYPFGSLLYVVNTATNTVVNTIPIGGPPRGVATSPDGSRVYTTNAGSNSVYVINTVTNTIVATVNVGINPQDIAVSPDGSRLYVANYLNNNISVINTATNTVVGLAAAGSNPAGVAISPDGSKVYVTNNNSDNVTIINTATNMMVASVQVGGHPVGVCVSPNGSRAYVANYLTHNLSVINTATNTVVETINLAPPGVGTYPYGVDISPDGSRVYVTNTQTNSVSVINTATNTVVANVAVGSNPQGVCVTPDGSRVYVCNLVSDNVSVINTATNTVVVTIPGITQPFAFSNFITSGVDRTKYYVNDNSLTGDVFTTSVGSNANSGFASTPFASLTHALSKATEGDTIYVDAGTYTEQVTIDKGITIIGAGQNLTSITNSASPLVPPPGPFSEYALIQTTQNIGDVHISNLQTANNPANDGHSILLQTGGSVKNCRILDGGLGVYVRVESATKAIVVENNFIQSSVFAVACQGADVTATITNNTLNVTNAGFSVGIWVGLDFGPIAKLTATGNSINNYVYRGIVGNSRNTVLSENSILGTGQYAIENTAAAAVASCNWYGSSDQYVVASKITGNVNFSPWLLNGTDNDPATIGFQPVPGSCAGKQLFFVNDNSLTGDIFTTAVGNNANNGTASAPLATITAALAKALPGDLIIVDAGNYTEQVNINKNISILGAGIGKTILNGVAGNITPYPNTGETGIIQTLNGLTEVIIENITVDGTNSNEQHGIFIQGGGRVANCELRYVNDGFYFQYLSTQPRTAIGNNNYVHHISFVGALFAGNGMTATATNNVIDLNGAQFGIGFIAGYGGDGNVALFTASNNTIINFNGFAMLIGSLQTSQAHNNSITRINGNYIQNAHTVNIDATCNWYGTSDAGVIIPYITGPISYASWLSSGIDNDAAMGFQPVPNSCNGRQNKFYVNDASQTGDIFTTAIGNDANTGIPSAPLLTISAALTKASVGDSIFVDAGTYATPNLTINKSVTILGSNYNTSPNNPADRLALNPVRNANSLITGSTFTIASNDVRLEGLAFNPGAKSQVTMSTAGINNFTFKRNYSIITSGILLNLNGPAIPIAQASTFGNYLVDDNRFESQVTAISTCIQIGALNDVTINNNTFFTPPTSAQRLLTNSLSGNGGLAINVIYSNNISNASRNEFFTAGNIASARIENNISLNGQRSIVLQPGLSISSDIQVRNNYIETNVTDLSPIQYLRSGTAAPGAVASIIIEHNTIIQNATGRTSVPAGILTQAFFTSGSSSTTIRRNTISFTGNYNSFASSSVLGVSLTGNWQNVNLEENEITFSGTNLTSVVPASGQSSSGISLSSDNGPSTIPATAVVNITGNKVNGFRNSVAVFDASSIAPNTFTGYGNLPPGVSVTINNNSFTGDVMSINNGTLGQSVNASCNWYGSATAQNIIGKITLATVDIAPWLTNGTDNGAATGFQPVPGSCDGYPTLITLNNFTNVTCNGASNGTINITTTYGKAPFTYTWTKDGDANFVSHVEDPTNLSPGVYHLTLLDGNGSTIYITDPEADGPGTIDVTITEPPVLTANASGTNVSCYNGSNGSASVVVGGGTLPYSYLWSNGGTTSSITNLTAGVYTVTVTDDNSCTKTASYQVTQPTLLTAVATGTSTSCANSATVVASGGTAPYNYLWSNAVTAQSITSLPAGTFTVTVTDGNGCQTTASCTVTATEAFNPSASAVNVSCFGGSNGSITVTNANGVAPFQYSINGVGFQSSNTFSGLVAGTYTITVKDLNGCTGFVTKTITQPTQLIVSQGTVQSTCVGSNTGSISIIVSGGSPSYTYLWSGTSFTSTQANISGLAAGDYNVTVTDSKGCTASLIVNVPSLSAINVNTNVTNVACRGDANGSIDITVGGGTGSGFTYLWNNGTTTQDRFGLVAGTYSVTITDIGSGCVVTSSYNITQPALALSLSVGSTNASGCNNLGTITAAGSGGTSPYQYKLDAGTYQNSGSFTGLSAGTYTVWVKDANGCTKSVAKTITDNGSDEFENNNNKGNAKEISLGATIAARIGTSGDVDYFKLGGSNTWVGNYTLSFVQPSTAVTFDLVASNGSTVISPTPATSTSPKQYVDLNGIYYIKVTGANSLSCYQFTVSSSLLTRSSGSNVQQEVTKAKSSKDVFDVAAYPNPSNSSFNVKVESNSNENVNLRVMDASGKLIEERKNIPASQIVKLGDRYINGVYLVEIVQGNNRKTIRLVKM